METLTLDCGQYQIFSTEAVQNMDPAELAAVAGQAADLIELLGGEHMFHPPAEILQAYLKAGMATFALNGKGKLGGFIKLDPWLNYEPGYELADDAPITEKLALLETGHASLGLLETGSLVVHPDDQGYGLGKELKVRMAGFAASSFTGVPVIAVVTNDNGPSLHNNYKLGWLPVDGSTIMAKTGIDVLKGWAPASTIFVSPQTAPYLQR